MTKPQLQAEVDGAVLRDGDALLTPAGFELIPHPDAPDEAYLFIAPDGRHFDIPLEIAFDDDAEPEKGSTWYITLNVPSENGDVTGGPNREELRGFIERLFEKLADLAARQTPEWGPRRLIWENPS